MWKNILMGGVDAKLCLAIVLEEEGGNYKYYLRFNSSDGSVPNTNLERVDNFRKISFFNWKMYFDSGKWWFVMSRVLKYANFDW